MQAILAAVAAHAVTAAPPPYGALPPPTSSARLFRLTLLAEQPLRISLFQSPAAAAAAPSPVAATAAPSPVAATAAPSPVAAAAPSTVAASAASHSPFSASAATKKAVAVLKGSSQVQGVVTLLQENNGPTTVKVRVTGLAPGPHGFHLHEYGDATNGCISTGAHFNPNKLTHGAPEDNIRHAGDLGNIFANSDGVAEATVIDSQIPLSGPTAVIGRSFVVHEFEDDLGKGRKELSLSTGNAGGRLACGIVGLTPV